MEAYCIEKTFKGLTWIYTFKLMQISQSSTCRQFPHVHKAIHRANNSMTSYRANRNSTGYIKIKIKIKISVSNLRP